MGDQGVLDGHSLGRDDEGTLRGPLKSNVADLGPVSLIDPVTNGPFQPAEVLVVARRIGRSFAHALEDPLAILFDMNIGVASFAGRGVVRRDDRRRPVLDSY